MGKSLYYKVSKLCSQRIPAIDMEYTQEQVKTYLSHIGFAARKCKPLTPKTVRAADGLNYLTALQICHLASIPFESLSLHYSQDRMISLDEEVLFDKMVGSGTGRGGYLDLRLFPQVRELWVRRVIKDGITRCHSSA